VAGAGQEDGTDPLPAAVEKPTFADWCVKRLKELLPVHSWLVAELGGGKGKRR
jgi:hypothetical protein